MKFTVVESFDVEKAIMDPDNSCMPNNIQIDKICNILNALMWDIDDRTKEYHIDWDTNKFIVLSAKYKTLYYFNHDEVPKVVRDALSRINKDGIHLNRESWAVVDEGRNYSATRKVPLMKTGKRRLKDQIESGRSGKDVSVLPAELWTVWWNC